MNTTALLAHAGHWAVWVLYAVPVLIVLGAAVRSYLTQRREIETDRRRGDRARRVREEPGG